MAVTSPTPLTARQALAAFKANPAMAPIAILDTTPNVAKFLATLQPMAKAGRITAIALSDSRTMPLTAARYFASTATIGLLPDRPLMIVAGITARDATLVQSDRRVKSFHLTDSAAALSASLDALNHATKVTVVTLTDTAPLAMTWHQLQTNTAILARMPASTSYRVADVPATSAGNAQANPRIMGFHATDAVPSLTVAAAGMAGMSKLLGVTAADTEATIRANLATITGIPRLARIVLTDTDTLRITAAQHAAHAGILTRLAPEESLSVTGVTADRARLVADAPFVETVTVADTLARITARIETLDAMARSGELTEITVTDKGAILTLTEEEQAGYSHALALMAGSYSQPASRPPVIKLSWDESVALAPAAFRPAVEYAARYFDTLITSPVTINIEVGWGEARDTALKTGLLGEAYVTTGLFRAFADYRADLTRANTSPTIQSALDHLVDPGRSLFIPGAQAKALGIMAPDPTRPDGSIGFAANPDLYTYDPNNRAVAGKVDLIGLVQHEITHALGRVSYRWGTTGFDLYRYQAPGVWAPTATGATYMSIDGGATSLGAFSMTGDPADWSGAMATDVQAAFLGTGIQLTYSHADIIALHTLGYAINTPTAGSAEPMMAFAHGIASNDEAFGGSGSAAWLAGLHEGIVLGATDLVPPLGLAMVEPVIPATPAGAWTWTEADTLPYLTGPEPV